MRIVDLRQVNAPIASLIDACVNFSKMDCLVDRDLIFRMDRPRVASSKTHPASVLAA
jgi:hypothetical protein